MECLASAFSNMSVETDDTHLMFSKLSLNNKSSHMMIKPKIISRILNDGSTRFFTPGNVEKLYFAFIHPELVKAQQLAKQFARRTSSSTVHGNIMHFFPIARMLHSIDQLDDMSLADGHRIVRKIANASDLKITVSVKMLRMMTMVIETLIRLARDNIAHQIRLGSPTISTAISTVEQKGLDPSIRRVSITTVF